MDRTEGENEQDKFNREVMEGYKRMETIAAAAIDGMTTPQAVAYLRHGAEMEQILKAAQNMLNEKDKQMILCNLATVLVDVDYILTKLEASHGK